MRRFQILEPRRLRRVVRLVAVWRDWARLAHVLVSKFAHDLPVYRQAEIYEPSGIDLDRSTLAHASPAGAKFEAPHWQSYIKPATTHKTRLPRVVNAY